MKKLSTYQTFENSLQSEDWDKIVFLQANKTRLKLAYFFYLISFGTFYLFNRWSPFLDLWKYDICLPNEASYVMIITKDGSHTIIPIEIIEIPISTLGYFGTEKTVEIKTFVFRFIRYYMKNDSSSFMPLKFETSYSGTDFHEKLGKGIKNPNEVTLRRKLFGECEINVPVPSIFSLVMIEVTHPFFLFQTFSVLLWTYEEYYLYSSVIFIFSIISVIATVSEIRSGISSIKSMARFECSISAFRDSQWKTISSKELVPGDLIHLPEHTQIPCDVVLISGSCLVDESMLTGESQPVLKEQISTANFYVYNSDKNCTISAGTKSLSHKGSCEAIVIATGFATAKGNLIRSILFPKPNRFGFVSDSMKFILIMTAIAVAGFIWTFVELADDDIDLLNKILAGLDLVTIIVPPALPFAMTVGTAFAISRMHRKNITCISPPAVNAAGRISVVCFDKTGTLTKDSMTLKGVWDANSGIFTDNLLECSHSFQENMATCQSLTCLNGKIVGDPQEEEIFKKLSWEWIESESERCRVRKNNIEIKIKNLFYFSPITKRMGVIIENQEGYGLHLKGAPEVIVPLCKEYPENLENLIKYYSSQSYRILACAYKPLSDYDPNENYENDMVFLGLILLQNEIKPNSYEVISELKCANIKCVMSTGDSLITAASIGKECGIIPKNTLIIYGTLSDRNVVWKNDSNKTIDITQLSDDFCLVLTGELLEFMASISYQNLHLVIEKGLIFSRMSPDQKVLLIQLLQTNNTMVAMVGDGANDCGALKAADVGLSLSEAESSIAAPFNGTRLNGIIDIIKEGRASLVTCLQSFKFIMMYSLIQFSVINILYLLDNNMTDSQYLYQDLFLIMPLAVFMAYTGAYDTLAKYMPPGALVSIPIVSSLIGHFAIIVIGQSVGYFSLILHDFYKESGSSLEFAWEGHSNTVLFLISTAQLLCIGVCLNIGPPFRKPAYENYLFTIAAIVAGVLNLYLIFMPSEGVQEILGLVDIPLEFSFVIFAIVCMGFACSFAYERVFVDFLSLSTYSSNKSIN